MPMYFCYSARNSKQHSKHHEKAKSYPHSLKSFGGLIDQLIEDTSAKLRLSLSQKFLEVRSARTKALNALSQQGFDDPEDLSKVYVQSNCQHHNSPDYH